MMPRRMQNDKPRVAVSRCLLGEPVRYDGAAKPHPQVLHVLARCCELVGLCPELEAGLGVPRPPVQLVEDSQRLRALGRDDPGLDVSAALRGSVEHLLPVLRQCAGVVLKSRSPSCGVTSTPVFDAAGRLLRHDSGLFAQALARYLPELPLIEESALEDAATRRHFLQQVRRRHVCLSASCCTTC